MPMIPFDQSIEEHVCSACGQTTHYVSKINKGMVEFLWTFQNAVRIKGINDILMKGMLVDPKDPQWADPAIRRANGRITHTQYDNRSHLRCHGLIAERGEPNHYLLTPKGASFLRGASVPAAAVVEKRTHSNVGYLANAAGEIAMTTIREVMKSDDGYWSGFSYDVAEDGSLIHHNAQDADSGANV